MSQTGGSGPSVTHIGGRPVPPEAERALGMRSYLTDTPGTGGRLRSEPEDFRVIELGAGPRRKEDGRFAVARVELRNWETNRFAGKAAAKLKVKRGAVGFAGMKDKRAVTEQWFSFPCPLQRVYELEQFQDVRVLESFQAADKVFPGSHDGNRFVLRIRSHEHADVGPCLQQIESAGGVPHFFGPQRFGSGVRPITHLMGKAIIHGDLEEAVRLYCGNPFPGEREDTAHARKIYEDTRDAAAALAAMPDNLDLEQAILKRLVKEPENWSYALRALPRNLLTLFIHAWQSYLFNEMLSARLEAGLGLGIHEGDRVMAHEEDGTQTVPVTAANIRRVEEEVAKGRASATHLLAGMEAPLAAGEPGDIEARVMEEHGMAPRDFRCFEMPHLASPGRRRTVLMPVRDLAHETLDGDPVVSFALGTGGYATTLMREVMKAGLEAY